MLVICGFFNNLLGREKAAHPAFNFIFKLLLLSFCLPPQILKVPDGPAPNFEPDLFHPVNCLCCSGNFSPLGLPYLLV
jgi:hypothetical protein